MVMRCGIVGLPNVGKSTLFNALTATTIAQAANYPFCTIEPNVGLVDVPDKRIQPLVDIAKCAKIIPSRLEFVDIAGLVKGASKGEGLGNKFLANIREVDAIVHVVRCFDNDDITHTEKTVDPIRDIEIINTELMIADLESLEGRMAGLLKRAKGGDLISKEQVRLMEPILKALGEGKPARFVEVKDEDKKAVEMLQILTTKPVVYVLNVEEGDAVLGNKYTQLVMDYAKKEGAECVVISAKIEQEISQLPVTEQKDYLEAIGLTETGLDKIIASGYKTLGLDTYFTVGPKECHAWTITKGTKAPGAAGVIHTDFERGFIAAEVISYTDYIKFKGEQGAKDNGKWRQEGKNYTVEDGDVITFRFNV